MTELMKLHRTLSYDDRVDEAYIVITGSVFYVSLHQLCHHDRVDEAYIEDTVYHDRVDEASM